VWLRARSLPGRQLGSGFNLQHSAEQNDTKQQAKPQHAVGIKADI
jgi:hypothetical protein